MPYFGLGVDYESGDPLFKSLDQGFVDNFLDVVKLQDEGKPDISKGEQILREFSPIQTNRSEDLNNPKEAGWTYVVNPDDPDRDEIVEIMKPLAILRGMADPSLPLWYDCENDDDWNRWLEDNFLALELEGRQTPQFVLLIGDPQLIPLKFQSLLSTSLSLGRLDFNDLTDLSNYVQKVVRLEGSNDHLLSKEAILFGPDGGVNDATHFSRQYMIEPLNAKLEDRFGFASRALIGDEARKSEFVELLISSNPALVYSASHGIAASNQPFELQKRVNGALVCQHSPDENMDKWLLTADDLPSDTSFLEGSLYFQFACFGYGTPAESDFEHWFRGGPAPLTKEDFVAAIPKKLLANPHGPVGYIGHVDTAFLHGFSDQNDPHLLEDWHPRMAPFVTAIESIFKVQPIGRALKDINARLNTTNQIITSTIDKDKRGRYEWTDKLTKKFIDYWIMRSDAQNYMLLGDPGARLQIRA